MTPPSIERRDFRSAVCQVWVDGQSEGTGFLVGANEIVTARHVVETIDRPSPRLRVVFPDSGFETDAEPIAFNEPQPGIDVLFLRLSEEPPHLTPLAFDAAARAGNGTGDVQLYGFPPGGAVAGQLATATLLTRIRGDDSSPWLQLTGATEVGKGFSGSPVVDSVTGFVVGMATALVPQDDQGRHTGTAFAVPADVLRGLNPHLSVNRIHPHKGLEPYAEADSQWFNGRNETINEILDALIQHPRFMALLGPSGSGKTSLIRAGVLPRLRASAPVGETWEVVPIRPTGGLRQQMEAAGLEGCLKDGVQSAIETWLAKRTNGTRLVLVIDQFEESLVGELEDEGGSQSLSELADVLEADLPVTLMVVMRNDFYARLSQASPRLLRWLKQSSVDMPSYLTESQLTEMVRTPADRLRVPFETGLAELIVRNTIEQAPAAGGLQRAADVQVLPLLEFTMTELWEQPQGPELSHAAYTRIGGVTGGLKAWCERTYMDLPKDLRPLAGMILTELVSVGRPEYDGPPVRRRRTVVQLINATGGMTGEAEVQRTLRFLSQGQRLLAMSEDPDEHEPFVDLIHESLIWNWPRMVEWLQFDLAFREWRSDAERSAIAWSTERDRSLLLRGSALAIAVGYEQARYLSDPLRPFIAASRRAERSRRGRLAATAGILVVLTAVALGLYGFQRKTAGRLTAQLQVSAARAALLRAEIVQDQSPDTALRLRLAADSIATSDETRAAVKANVTEFLNKRIARVLSAHTDRVTAMAISRDGSSLLTASRDMTITFWDPNHLDGGRPSSVMPTDIAPTAIALSPDGSVLAVGGDGGTTEFWKISDRTKPALLGRTAEEGQQPVTAISFQDSHTVATSIEGSTVIWTVAEGHIDELSRVNLNDEYALDGQFLLSGRFLTAFSPNTGLKIWDMGNPSRPRTVQTLGQEEGIQSIAHDDQSHLLATITEGFNAVTSVINLYRLEEDGHLTRIGRPVSVGKDATAIAVRPGSAEVSVAQADHKISVWSFAHPTRPARLIELTGHTDSILDLRYTPDGSHLISSSYDHNTIVWDAQDTAAPKQVALMVNNSVSDAQIAAANEEATIWHIGALVYSPDGKTVIAVRSSGTAAVFDVTNPDEPRQVSRIDAPPNDLDLNPGELEEGSEDGHSFSSEDVTSAAYSRDGRVLALGTRNRFSIWDVTNPRHPMRLSLLEGAQVNPEGLLETAISAMSLDAAGDLLAGAASGGQPRVWSLADPTKPELLQTLSAHGDAYQAPVTALALSPDGKVLVTAGQDELTIVWDLSNPRKARKLTTLVGHSGAVSAMAYSTDGRLLATVDGQVAILWDLEEPARPRRLTSFTDSAGGIRSVAFGPDNVTMALGTTAGTATLYDVTNPELPVRVAPMPKLFRHNGSDAAKSITFSPDGTHLAISEESFSSTLWSIAKTVAGPRNPRAAGCALAGRGLTEDEWLANGISAPYRDSCSNTRS